MPHDKTGSAFPTISQSVCLLCLDSCTPSESQSDEGDMGTCGSNAFLLVRHVGYVGSFRVSLFIDLGCPLDLGECSGCSMIIRWLIS